MSEFSRKGDLAWVASEGILESDSYFRKRVGFE